MWFFSEGAVVVVSLLLLLFETFPLIRANDCPEFPEIIIQDSYPNVSATLVGGNNSTIYFSENVFIVLKCSSQKPIFWNYAHDHSLNQWRFIRPKRTSINPLDPDTFCFEATLFLYTGINATGEYTCEEFKPQSDQSELKSASVYLFIDDKKVSPLTINWQPQLKIENPEISDGWIQIPCKTTNPDASVELFKNDIQIELEGNSLRWDNKKGFSLNTRVHFPYHGTYRCKSSENNQNGSRRVRILMKEPSPLPHIEMAATRREVVCQVPQRENLELVFKKCNNLMECLNTQKRMPYKDAGDTWSTGPDCSCREENTCLCHTIPDISGDLASTGVVECLARGSSDAVSVSRFLYQFYGLSGQEYALTEDKCLSVGSSDPVDVVSISMTPDKGPLYVNQVIEFNCKAVSFLISEGIRYAWMNETTLSEAQYEELSEVLDSERQGFTVISQLKIKLRSTEIKKVICLAPLWNSYGWINSSKEINIRDPVKPAIISSTPRNLNDEGDSPPTFVYTKDRNVSFNCSARGDPKPKISWLKVGSPTLPSGAFQLDIPVYTSSGRADESIASSLLVFPTVTQDVSGKYACVASNYGGNTTKTVNVEVLSEQSKWLLGIILGSVASIVLLIIVVIFLYRRLVVQKRFIRQILSETEVEEFFCGNLEKRKSNKNKSAGITEYAQFLPYKKEYEIPSSSLQIDEEHELGSGQYGMVYKAKLTAAGGTDEKDIPVAVKTTKPGAEKEYLKALLSEIKIMIAIGAHDNVVKFIGALTENIRDGKLLIVVEFCGRGSLEKYLRNNRKYFLNQVQDDVINTHKTSELHDEKVLRMNELSSTNNIDEEDDTDRLPLNTCQLVKWACEIAAGMEYLADKKVIHADLACRNVLITKDGLLKITDFGLSRQLYENMDYVKQSQDPLPWRWMALESIRDMNFSVQSDIWSYGVTAWEIFSLGATPFPGYTWEASFLQKLEEGLRPEMPPHATTSIYQNMVACWSCDPESRPSFTAIRNFYRQVLQRINENPQATDYVRMFDSYLSG